MTRTTKLHKTVKSNLLWRSSKRDFGLFNSPSERSSRSSDSSTSSTGSPRAKHSLLFCNRSFSIWLYLKVNYEIIISAINSSTAFKIYYMQYNISVSGFKRSLLSFMVCSLYLFFLNPHFWLDIFNNTDIQTLVAKLLLHF